MTQYLIFFLLLVVVLTVVVTQQSGVIEKMQPISLTIPPNISKPKEACVINLKRRRDRLKIFNGKLKKALKYDILDAVDGKELDINTLVNDGMLGAVGLKSIIDTNRGRSKKHHYELCTLGAVGCYLSHVKAWEQVVKEGVKYKFIFEDDADVGIPKEVLQQYRENLKHLPRGWHIYNIGQPHTMLETRDVDPFKYPFLKKMLRFCGTHAYIVSQEGARWLLENGQLFPIQQQVDCHMSELATDHGLDVYIHKDVPLIPPISDRSDIQVDGSHFADKERLRF